MNNSSILLDDLPTDWEAKKIKYVFEERDFDELYSFTSVVNARSERIMQKIGMMNTYKNFFHPKISREHILCEHVLYKITRRQYEQ